jgi:hypothetical protein
MLALRVNLRLAALIAVGALAVHDLRVLAGYGRDADLIMREPAHAYLPFATGLAAMLLLAASVQLTRSLTGAALDRSRVAQTASTWRRWLVVSLLLVGTYLVQASAESFFDPGHPIIGHGGWSVVPLALAVGFVIAVVSREADRAVLSGPALPMTLCVRACELVRVLALSRASSRRPVPLAAKGAGRAPPLRT